MFNQAIYRSGPVARRLFLTGPVVDDADVFHGDHGAAAGFLDHFGKDGPECINSGLLIDDFYHHGHVAGKIQQFGCADVVGGAVTQYTLQHGGAGDAFLPGPFYNGFV